MKRCIAGAVVIILGAMSMSAPARAGAPSTPRRGGSSPASVASGALRAKELPDAPTPVAADVRSIRPSLSSIHVPFVENAGQADPRVKYSLATFAGTLFVTSRGELVHALPGWSLVETFVGGTPVPHGGSRAATTVSRFVGDASQHRASVATFDDVRLGEVFPGIEVSLRAASDNVEKIFTVHPGADPSRIRLRVDGAEHLSITNGGALALATGNGDVVMTPPVAYQVIAGSRRAVDVRYSLDAAAGDYGFALGDYDRDEALVIDPLLQSTFLGGTGGDYLNAITVNASGEILVAGITNSTDFPGTSGGARTAHAADSNLSDVMVARYNSSLTTLLQATYFGGNNGDQATGIAVNPNNGEVLVTGNTRSTNLPGTTGGAQPAHAADGNSDDAFVARFNSSLTSLLQATYFGGNSFDDASSIRVHPTTGDILVAGSTSSSNLPGTAGGAQAAAGGFSDGFVVRYNPTLTAVLQSTYLGGSSYDSINAIAVHPASGEIIVAGAANSLNFPGTTNGAQATHAADPNVGDGFVARLDSTLTTLIQSTYVGGTGAETLSALAVHPTSGEIVVAGTTTSHNIAGSTNGAQPAHANDTGDNDGYVVRLSANLQTLLQSTYYGGTGRDTVTSLAIHPTSGEILVAGYTQSSNIPGTTNGAQATHAADGGNEDGFVVRFNSALTAIQQATYLGGSLADQVGAMTVHPSSGEVLVAGYTQSTDLPGTAHGAQPAHASDTDDAFVARFTASLAVPTGLGCLDPDRNDAIDALTDGLMIIRAMFGLTGTAVTNSAVGPGAGRTDWASIRSYLNTNCGTNFAAGLSETPAADTASLARLVPGPGPLCTLDIDGNGNIDALTDGLMAMRAMFGLTGTSVTQNAVGANATRADWTSIRAYLNGSCGASFQP